MNLLKVIGAACLSILVVANKEIGENGSHSVTLAHNVV
jgi:hypothetical protein